MLRLSTNNDINGVIAVWKEAFGDSEDDIRFFLDKYYIPENTVVYEYNGEIASVLFLIDGDMFIKRNNYHSYYLYAACTLKKFRGRGMMSEMLDFSKNLAFERKKYFIVLKPAEESLYNYYSKFGYLSLFSKKKVAKSINNNISAYIETNKNIDYSQLRDNAYINIDYFRWTKMSVDFAVEHHKHYGGEVFCNSEGYILFFVENKTLYIKENTFSEKNFWAIINKIASERKKENVIAEIPFGFNFENCKTEIIKSGMILPVSKEASITIKTVNDAYLSLTLD